ncbi:helix-turn-helix domain-containing protein [Pedobacter hiemivivus]|uniref:Helix-turn-helix domain-containing protein n=1 Tax=Pedobacter hiemivivus TaxID=2530454 RepID=A0A4R0MZG8_9SPHI|nr:helix-turn-helix domain-containing protein [Pedobacter hiemivivus]TCC92715.1 helix-turn-helix domain-containing protein [Pedobacter hiemivivus]TKC56217.1 helix-turn-helix domain-containing protein [Pedobacter hiemivivus]
MDLNVGKVIERAVRRDHMGISALSRKLHVSRRTIYNWFDQESLSFEIICKIGNAIKYDFSKEFPDDFARIDDEIGSNMNQFTNGDNSSPESFSSSVNYWMNKYIKLLEKYNELLSHKFPT